MFDGTVFVRSKATWLTRQDADKFKHQFNHYFKMGAVIQQKEEKIDE